MQDGSRKGAKPQRKNRKVRQYSERRQTISLRIREAGDRTPYREIQLGFDPSATADGTDFMSQLQIYPASFFLTVSLTVFPSAFLPASFTITLFITAPISFIDVAPVSVIASVTACSISASDAACGK